MALVSCSRLYGITFASHPLLLELKQIMDVTCGKSLGKLYCIFFNVHIFQITINSYMGARRIFCKWGGGGGQATKGNGYLILREY